MKAKSLASIVVAAATLSVGISGCIGGGSRIARDEVIPASRIVATYRTPGDTPNAVTYQLLQADDGLGCLELDSEGNRTLAASHWTDAEGDHFAMWVELFSSQGHAFELVFPKDRSRSGKKYVYPPDGYTIITVGGERRPVPTQREKHFASPLHPVSL